MGELDCRDDASSLHAQDMAAAMGTGHVALPQIVCALPIALALSLFLWMLGFLAEGLEAYLG